MKRTSLSYVSVKLLPIFFIRSFLRLVLPNDGKGGNRWRRNNSRWGKMSGEIFFSFGRISIREGACTARVRGKVVRWWPFRCKNYSCEWLWKLLQLERNAEKSFLVKFDRKKVEKKWKTFLKFVPIWRPKKFMSSCRLCRRAKKCEIPTKETLLERYQLVIFYLHFT
jgi:hypothetical protein